MAGYFPIDFSVSRTRCSTSWWCTAEPESYQTPASVAAPAQQRTAARCAASGARDRALLRRLPLRTREPQQRVVIHGLDRREIAMRDVVRPRRGADVIRDRVERQVYDLARIGRDVAGRAMHQIAVKHQ